jgi:GDP-L-fucose synthase
LIRKCIEAKERGEKKVEVWGDGSPTREFLYVEDAAEGILLAAEHYQRSDPVNLGSGQEVSIMHLTELISGITGFDGDLFWDTTKPNGQPRRALDTSKAEKFFGFKAKMPLQEGLHKTVDWYQAYRKQKVGGKA